MVKLRTAGIKMKDALKEARLNLLNGNDIPIGCVIKKNGKIVASARNKREENTDITAHAEILAIKDAQKVLGTSRLHDCELYVTLEPCPMCAWAIIQSGIKTVYFGSYNPQYGAFGSNQDLQLIKLANSKIKVYGGIEEEECDKLLNNFFKSIREKDL